MDLHALTGTNDEKCSGEETRTLNHAGFERDEYQHPS
jgi:hypothetical protein